jgi:bis(5'-nucleosidyl)-tetraphosphatase
MVDETSTGGIIYHINNGRILFLLLKQSTNKLWEFPKGNIDNNEKEVDCARREIKEESGLEVDLDNNLKWEIDYINPKKGKAWEKKDIFYLCKVKNTKVCLSWEHCDFKWVSLQEGLKLIKFDNLKKVLIEAHKKIIIKENLIEKEYNKILKKFEEKIKKIERVLCYFVTGSYFNKKLKKGSDLDIFVVSAPSTKRSKGIMIIDNVKVSYFMNPINKVYNLLISEKGKLKRPTTEMIFFSDNFLNEKLSIELKNLAEKTYCSKMPKIEKSEQKYYGWKLYDKMTSFLRSPLNEEKSIYLEIDLFNFLIDLFFMHKREYVPNAKYLIDKTIELDKNFGEKILNYLGDRNNSRRHLEILCRYILKALKFKKKDYYRIGNIF